MATSSRTRRTSTKRAPARGRRLQAAGKSRMEGIVRTGRAVYAGAQLGYKAATAYNKYKTVREAAKKRQVFGNNTVDNDYKYKYISYKKPLTVQRMASKFQRMGIQNYRLCLRNYGAWNRGNGEVFLRSEQAGALGTEVNSPVHLWDLTAAPRVQSGSGGTLQYAPCWMQLSFTNETASTNCYWRTWNGGSWVTVNSDNQTFVPTDSQWALHYATTPNTGVGVTSNPLNSTNALPVKTLLSHATVNLGLYGPRQACTKYQVQLVQLSDEAQPWRTDQKATAIWQSVAKYWGFSPMETGNFALVRKNIKVLKEWNVHFESPESSEDHLAARLRHLTMKLNLNRKCNYDWEKTPDLMKISMEDTMMDADISQELAHTNVHPKARLYLMVKALVTYQGPNSGGSVDPNLMPSYDIKIDTYHKTM